jgi:hypothetical protein
MLSVMVMLSSAMFWSPQYDSPPGIGACYAQCVFTYDDKALMFSEYELSIHQTIFNYIGALQTALFAYEYATTALFVFPIWHSIYQFLIWALPGYFFRLVENLIRRLERWWKGHNTPLNLNAFSQKARHIWKTISFPSPRTAIFIQVFSWSFGLAMLSLDRWGRARKSVSSPESEDQWGFGQLLAVIILFLPLFPFIETWSGECIVVPNLVPSR